MWLKSMNHHPITNVFQIPKTEVLSLIMYFAVEIDSLTTFQSPNPILLTSNLGGKTPGFVKAAYPKSSVQSQEEGHHTKLLGLESQPIATCFHRWQKGWDFFLAKKWYRLMLHHNLWHLWFIYIMSVVLFSSVTTLHVPKHYICGVSSDLHKLVIDFSKLNKI